MDLQPLADLLHQSVLNPEQARASEQQLRSSENEPRFSIMLLHIVAGENFSMQTRLAGALFFKNFIKRKWTDEEGNYRIPEQDVKDLKIEIIGLMIQLPKNLQVQIGEAVSIMADSDFPDRWESLVPNLVGQLGRDTKTNNGVLTVAHSIFKRWRPLFRSDELFKEIKLVLDQFCQPYLQLFSTTDEAIQQTSDVNQLTGLMETMHLMIKIYFDLNCQDLPEFFEDNMKAFMGVFHKYLVYNNPQLEGDEDESGVLENLKSSICEVLELYTQRYEEEFGSMLPQFVEITWNLLTTTGAQPKNDLLVSKALAFLTAVAKLPRQAHIFEGPLEQVIQAIILPNMALRTSDEELFEDDPIEYIRRDLEGSDSDTRRRAATDFIRELAAQLESKVTHMVMKYVDAHLSKYNQDKSGNWRDKDAAIYLFSAISAKGNVTSSGMSNANIMTDVVQFFTTNVAPDLMDNGNSNNVQPILKVDAIKYLYTFRNQLTKEQLQQTLPLLKNHLESSEYVVYSYAAITIERVLAIREGGANGKLMFTKQDINDEAQNLLTSLFKIIVSAKTPEKLAENEYLIKCIMRILVTAQEGISPFAEEILQQLIAIVGEISKNPSNPRFSHYTFESIGSLVRFCSPSLGTQRIESIVMPAFMSILQQDVQEFMPYVFQILSQLLRAADNNNNNQLPEAYQQLIRPLMAPALWETKGNVQALVDLLQAILSHGGAQTILSSGQLEPLLGVFQKLVSSKVSDGMALDLLEEVFLGISVDQINIQYLNTIGTLLLQRLQSSRTEKFTIRLARLVYFLSAIEKPGLGPAFAIQLFDGVQQGIFGQIYPSFVLDNTLKIQGANNRKTAAVGLVRLICTDKFVQGEYNTQLGKSINELVSLLQTPVPQIVEEDVVKGLDAEDISFGASFSKLATTSTGQVDPAPSVTDSRAYCIEQLQQLNRQHNGALQQLGDLQPDTVTFMQQNNI